MTVWNSFEYFFTDPFPEFHHSLLVAGWAEVPTLARKCQKILMAVVVAFDSGEAILEDATIKVAINYMLNIRPEKAILPFKTVFVNLLKCFEIIFNTSIIC